MLLLSIKKKYIHTHTLHRNTPKNVCFLSFLGRDNYCLEIRGQGKGRDTVCITVQKVTQYRDIRNCTTVCKAMQELHYCM
jgi:hypothetical protein